MGADRLKFNPEALSLNHTNHGEVAEWSKAAVLKTVEPRGSQGSNPCLSAINTIKTISYSYLASIPNIKPNLDRIAIF